jgi:hypothetical protein
MERFRNRKKEKQTIETKMHLICRGPKMCFVSGLQNTNLEYEDAGWISASTVDLCHASVNVVRRYNTEHRLVFLRAILRTELSHLTLLLELSSGPNLKLLAAVGSVTLKETRDYENNTCTVAVNDKKETQTMIDYARRFGSVVDRWLPLFWFFRGSAMLKNDKDFLRVVHLIGDGCKPLFWS